MNSGQPRHDAQRPLTYRIRIRGHLGRQWGDWLGGMDIAWLDGGDTLLTGPIVDQAALHGLLRRLRDLGVTLISIHTEEESMASNMQAVSGMTPGRVGVKTLVSGDRKMVLSTLWIFAQVNYIYADIFTAFFNPPVAGSMTMSGSTVLVYAMLMETGIAMVLLSRILTRGWNRWLNMVVGLIQTAFVTFSLFGQAPKPFYIFFVCIEVATSLFIVGYAWAWKKEQALSA